jgi:hypothetical protein
MKKALLTSLVILSTLIAGQAQFGTCIPDPSYQDSMAGVYPLPYDALTNPTGGITDSACLNKDYQFVFTAVVGDSLNFGGFIYILDSLKIDSLVGLPEGFDYNCNNPTCTFYQNELGCAVIYGKATNPADIGSHNLTIFAKIFTGGLPISLSFPNPLLAPGNFFLWVLPEDSPNCYVYTSAFEVASEFESIRNVPNPFTGITTIEVDSREAGSYQLRVADMLGRVVHTQTVQINQGLNQVAFDGSQLPDGLYLYTFSNGRSQVTQKMQILR